MGATVVMNICVVMIVAKDVAAAPEGGCKPMMCQASLLAAASASYCKFIFVDVLFVKM